MVDAVAIVPLLTIVVPILLCQCFVFIGVNLHGPAHVLPIQAVYANYSLLSGIVCLSPSLAIILSLILLLDLYNPWLHSISILCVAKMGCCRVLFSYSIRFFVGVVSDLVFIFVLFIHSMLPNRLFFLERNKSRSEYSWKSPSQRNSIFYHWLVLYESKWKCNRNSIFTRNGLMICMNVCV